MDAEHTIPQGGEERRRSQEISLRQGEPPTAVPGYVAERRLGVGAYGEVWVAVDQNTGRRVAIKFYAHRGGLDWSLLSREVEKLALLFADRYVVQLIGVGWNAEPPYYIMEYLERGSLADRLQQGPLPVGEAVQMLRDVATGLVHAHDKGVLHCDLKPANILLDQDGKPRLADFGQSRLSHEQAPALGTLFYMAPEQADLAAVPEARWDVYALGALLYCMLTGEPPHRNQQTIARLERAPNLKTRLSKYQRLVRRSPRPRAHYRVRGVDRPLAEIMDRCLAVDPEQRYPNVQAVLDALAARDARRARRPLMLLGAIGPALMLLIVAWFAWQGFSTAMKESDEALRQRAFKTNRFVAENVAEMAGVELDRRFGAVRRAAESETLRRALAADIDENPEIQKLLEKLLAPELGETDSARLRKAFREDPARKRLQAALDQIVGRNPISNTAGWSLFDARGVQVARTPEGPGVRSLGRYYGWRAYFHGEKEDREPSWRVPAGAHITAMTISPVYRSTATDRWIVSLAAPLYDVSSERKFLGVVTLMVEVGRFVKFQEGDEQFAVMVDAREGKNQGLILQHPKLEALLAEKGGELDDADLQRFRVTLHEAPNHPGRLLQYVDPFSPQPAAKQNWLAEAQSVRALERDSGLKVIVQESYASAIGSTLTRLRTSLIRHGILALAAFAVVMIGLWVLALRLPGQALPRLPEGGTGSQPSDSAGTPLTPVVTNTPTETHKKK